MAGTAAAGMAGAVTAASSATAVIVIMLDLSCHNGGMREEIGMLILVKAALLQIRPAADRRLGFAVMADDHIDDMEQLRQGIGLQAYGQRDPLVEYKMAGYEMFDAMTANIQEDTIKLLYHVRVEQKVEREQVAKVTGTNKDDTVANAPKKRENRKIYPNDPCPCGSGKKYKQCCGRLEK